MEFIKDAYGNNYEHSVSVGDENSAYKDINLEANTEYYIEIRKVGMASYSLAVNEESKISLNTNHNNF